MSAPNYQLNPADAREGSGGGRLRINSNGAFEGKFTKAKHITASTGAAGIEFEFETSAESARFTLYTANKDGQPIYGAKQLQALMAVLKLRAITAKMATIEEYDYDLKTNVAGPAEIYPDLMNKPVGIVFQMEEYESQQDGTVKLRPNFFAPFDPATKKVAAEILDQSPATKLEKIVAGLKTKTLQPQSHAPQHTNHPGQTPVDLNDDIPF
jgi:hypothetical protein